MRYNDVKKFLDLVGEDTPFAIFTKGYESDEDYFEVADHCELLENSLLIIETPADDKEYHYLFDLDEISELRSNY